MNPIYLEVVALVVLAGAMVWIVSRLSSNLSSTLSSLLEPFRSLSGMQSRALEVQQATVEGQSLAVAAQQQAVAAHTEAAGTLRMVIQRSLEISEHADRSARKLSSATELLKDKAGDVDQARKAFEAGLVELRKLASDLAESRELITETARRLTNLEEGLQANQEDFVRRLSYLSTNETVSGLRQFMTDGLRELLMRDLSRAATMYPRRIRLDLIASGIETLGRVDGGVFLGALRRARFRLVCEAGDCDKRGHTFVSESQYEIQQVSHFIGAMKKVSGASDPGVSVYDGINRFDHAIVSASAEGARIVLTVTVKLALANTVAVYSTIELVPGMGEYLDRLKKGNVKPEEMREFWQFVDEHEFVVRDIGGSAHAQLGYLIQHSDENKNLPVFGGLSRILDPHRGYMWVCPAHAQEFMDSIRGLTE
jgi:hypothetical protein